MPRKQIARKSSTTGKGGVTGEPVERAEASIVSSCSPTTFRAEKPFMSKGQVDAKRANGNNVVEALGLRLKLDGHRV